MTSVKVYLSSKRRMEHQVLKINFEVMVYIYVPVFSFKNPVVCHMRQDL